MKRAWVLSQGDEVVTGQVADTNAAFLGERLTELGLEVTRHVSVGDRLEDIEALFREAGRGAEVAICTGGLGPTEDDLTAEAAARAAGVELALDGVSLARIEAFFARLDRPMAEVNRKQAMLPEGAMRLDNDHGTAPGFRLAIGRALVYCLPGVPREMKPMFDELVVADLRASLALRPRRLVTLRTAGIGESDLQERLGSIADERFVLSYRTKLPENHVKLRFDPDLDESELRGVVDQLAVRIGSPLFAIEGLGAAGGALEEVVARALLEARATLALVEGASAGTIAQRLARWPGAADFLVSAHVDLRLPLAEVGEAAATAREESGADYALALSALDERERGRQPSACVELAWEGGRAGFEGRLFGSAERRQELAAGAGLDLLRRRLFDKLPAS